MQPVSGVAPAVQVRGVLDLGHHMGGDRPGKPLAGLGVVLGVEDRGGGQAAVVPAVPAGVPEESVQRRDMPLAAARAADWRCRSAR